MWYIQDEVFGHYEQSKLKAALDNLDRPHKTSDPQFPMFPAFLEYRPSPIFRGTVEFLEKISSDFEINTGVTIDNYDCSKYYQYWSNWMLNKRHFFVPWGTLKHCANDYFDWLGSEKLFIRPNSGRKIFTGNYITKKWWPRDIETIAGLPGNTPSDEDMVLVARYQGIAAEYRVVMHFDKVISFSRYDDNENSQTLCEDELVEYCESAAWSSSFFPDDYYTIDIALMQDGNLKVLELNSLFSAGWYDADYEKIIKHVEKHL